MKRQLSAIRLMACLLVIFLQHPGSLQAGTGNSTASFRQGLTITGVVRDENGAGLPGVNVLEKGSTNGVITGLDGDYTIRVAGPGSVLIFTFIGYTTREITVEGSATIDVDMSPELVNIEEVVVVGYGQQKKATLSGSVSSVRGSEIVKSPALNITNTIGGTVPGLVAVGQSGEPGEDYASLFIRGRSTLNNNSPLIVVDGIPNRSLERIDPSTIESITVLKDASAAIYGSQAANGVILVTTKRGSAEKMVVRADYTAGWSKPTMLPDMTNAAQYAELVNEVDYYDQRPATYSAEQIATFASESDRWLNPDTDWFGEVLKPWSMQQNINLSMSGGTEKLQSFVSLSTRQQDGFFVNSASRYAQHDFRANIDHQFTDNISLSLDASARLEDREAPTVSSAAIFRDLINALPLQRAYWPNGMPGPVLNPTSQNNPAVQSTPDAGVSQGENYVFNLNAKLNIKIPRVEGLSLTFTGALDRGLNYSKYFSKKYTLYSWDGTTLGSDNLPLLIGNTYGTSDMKQQLDIAKEYLVSALVSYQRVFNEVHSLNLLAGSEAIEMTSNWFSAMRKNFANNFPEELDFGDSNQQFADGSNPGVNRWQNYFGRVNYSYAGKYIAEFVWRYQGSSKFAPETRWGFFPGVSVAYRISEEEFWKTGKAGELIRNMKIRASWGKTGNDLIDPYQFYSLYELNWQYFVTGNGVTHPVYYESLASNYKAQWEEARQANVGIDLTLMKDRLTLTADYFNNLRTKILITQSASVPATSGLAGILPDINLGEVRNYGFDFEATWREKAGELLYSLSLNGCYAENRVLFFDEAEGAPEWQKQTGYPMQSGLYYEAIGIFKTQDDLDNYPHLAEARTGDVIFRDVNEDGEITGDDMRRIYKNIVPKFTAGLNLSASWKGFDLTVLFQGQAGAVRYVQYLGGKNTSNYFTDFYENRWTEENPDADYPRTFNRNDEYWVSSDNPNTFWLRKTDFIRLKNLELGYSLPADLTRKIGLEGARLHAGGMNLLTWAPDMKDFDPELEPKGDGFAGQGYPLQKIVTLGLSINF